MFSGDEYWRFDDEKQEVAAGDPPFPRPTRTWWFGCWLTNQHLVVRLLTYQPAHGGSAADSPNSTCWFGCWLTNQHLVVRLLTHQPAPGGSAADSSTSTWWFGCWLTKQHLVVRLLTHQTAPGGSAADLPTNTWLQTHHPAPGDSAPGCSAAGGANIPTITWWFGCWHTNQHLVVLLLIHQPAPGGSAAD